MCVGHTLGEESIFDKNRGALYRSESVIANIPSCVL